jgi:hypothetical protein
VKARIKLPRTLNGNILNYIDFKWIICIRRTIFHISFLIPNRKKLIYKRWVLLITYMINLSLWLAHVFFCKTLGMTHMHTRYQEIFSGKIFQEVLSEVEQQCWMVMNWSLTQSFQKKNPNHFISKFLKYPTNRKRRKIVVLNMFIFW